ncbi:MAG: pyruvate formate lyase family protein [Desulfobacterales bacterium]
MALNLENANTGFSFGRLDLAAPAFLTADMEKLTAPEARAAISRHAVELVGSLFLRFSDHLPLSRISVTICSAAHHPTQALTIGGMTPDGRDAINDMTHQYA